MKLVWHVKAVITDGILPRGHVENQTNTFVVHYSAQMANRLFPNI